MINIVKYYIEKRMRICSTVRFWEKKGAKIGVGCSIHPSASLGSEPYLIEIGNHVRLNSGVNIVTHDGGMWVLRELYSEMKDADLFGKIKIGDNVHIGTNAMIMPNVCVGNNCIIGSCAVVTKSVPDNCVVVGVPARVIETIDDYRKKHVNSVLYTKNKKEEEKKEIVIQYFKRGGKGKD